jgi:hypothetical protein
MTTNTMISELIERFPTSELLFAWLRSEEGGKLTVREDWMTPDEPLALIHYQKDKSNMELPHTGLFRSVIWDTIAHRPVCIGPARGIKFSAAIDAAVDIATTVVEDFIDGPMINLFNYRGRWRIATRTVIDAECNFYAARGRYFADLFWETFRAQGLALEMLVPGATYSFVLQHPEERVVVAPKYGIAKLYLVETSAADLLPALKALKPQVHSDLKTLEDVKERVVAWGKRFRADWQGLVIKVGGTRYKLRSDQYDEARHLRGNQNNRPYIWLTRWSDGRLGAYLRQYPEEQHEADAVIAAFKAETQAAHACYLQVYRNRAFPLGQAPAKYRKILWDAHAANKGVYFPHFRQFMNELDAARKLWLVNFDKRFGAAAVVEA